MAVSPTVRRRLERQGFVGFGDDELAEAAPWLRFSPALCAAVMAVGTALASPAVLWALAAPAALGTVFPVHPFDVLYNYGLRRLTGTRRLPKNGAPRRFACGMATAWLIAAGVAFAADADVAGYALGGVLTAVAAVVATTHFCIPSLIYRSACARLPLPGAVPAGD